MKFVWVFAAFIVALVSFTEGYPHDQDGRPDTLGPEFTDREAVEKCSKECKGLDRNPGKGEVASLYDQCFYSCIWKY